MIRGEDGTLYLLFEYMNGGDVYESIIKKGEAEGRREGGRDVRGMMKQLLEALVCVHGRGLLHRDVKPENLLLQVEKEDEDEEGKEEGVEEGLKEERRNINTRRTTRSSSSSSSTTSSSSSSSSSPSSSGRAPPKPPLLKLADFGLARPILLPSSSSSSPSASSSSSSPLPPSLPQPPLTDYVATRWYRAPELLLHFPSYSW